MCCYFLRVPGGRKGRPGSPSARRTSLDTPCRSEERGTASDSVACKGDTPLCSFERIVSRAESEVTIHAGGTSAPRARALLLGPPQHYEVVCYSSPAGAGTPFLRSLWSCAHHVRGCCGRTKNYRGKQKSGCDFGAFDFGPPRSYSSEIRRKQKKRN